MSELGEGDAAKVFICYARKDDRLCKELRASLAIIHWEARPSFEVWHDEDVEVGAEWPDELRLKLRQADIFVVLLSMWLMQSDFIRDIEFPVISERRLHGQATVLVVPVTRLELGTTPFASIQHVLPRPLSEYLRRDEAWQLVARAVLNEASQRVRQRATPRPASADHLTDVDDTETDESANVIPLHRKREVTRLAAHSAGANHLEAILDSFRAFPLQSDPGWASFRIRMGPVFLVLDRAIMSAQLSPWAHEQALVLRSTLRVLCTSHSEPSDRSRALHAARQAALTLEATSGS